MTARIGLVWAEAHGGVIGADGGMPWNVPEDLAHFKQVTLGAPVVMGRRTWESFPPRFRPLPGRRNIVVTRNAEWSAEGAERAGSLADAIRIADDLDAPAARALDPAASAPVWIWIIGGAGLFREGIALADRLEVTELDLDVGGDTFAPDRSDWNPVSIEPEAGWARSSGGIRYRFVTLARAT